MPRLGAASHGESRLRLLRIVRRGDRHDARDLTVSLRFEGAFGEAFLEGRADGTVPRASLRTLVHDVVRDAGRAEIELLGLALSERVLAAHSAVTRVRIELIERPWARLIAGGKAQGQTFVQQDPEQRTAAVVSNGARTAVVAGIEQLRLMRTAGFLPNAARGDRAEDGREDGVQALLVGTLGARWTYGHADLPFGVYRTGVRAAITETFALHAARSVQHTLYAIATVVLATYEDILDVTLTMHERPCQPGDIFRSSPEAVEDLFLIGEEPTRLVEVTLERDSPAVPTASP